MRRRSANTPAGIPAGHGRRAFVVHARAGAVWFWQTQRPPRNRTPEVTEQAMRPASAGQDGR
jgi:hypothetical protein